MKFFAIVALVATTQATAGVMWAKADATDGCAEGTYSCKIESCATDAGDNGNVCVPNGNTYAASDTTKSTGDTLPTANDATYESDAACAAAAACAAPEAAASALVASAAALATALYTLA